jgi:hypothetical protein
MGEVVVGVTFEVTPGRFRLAKLATVATNLLFRNGAREDLFRKSPNEAREAVINGETQQIGLHDMGSVGENKFVGLTFQALVAEMCQLPTLWAAAGVPTRWVKFLHAFRHDSYSTVDERDGFQTGRSMLFLREDVERAGTDSSFLSSETEIPYQKDRLRIMQEVYRVWRSGEESDKWRVIEIEVPVPELLFLGADIERLKAAAASLSDTVATATGAIAALRELGGELSGNRLDELANKAAHNAVEEVSRQMRRAFGEG